MKLAATLLVAICLAFAYHATQDPAAPADAETAIEPSKAPVVPIRVGGPCADETTEIDATVLQVADGLVSMRRTEDRNFNLAAAAFTAPTVAGDVIGVTKRKITKGTCQPLI